MSRWWGVAPDRRRTVEETGKGNDGVLSAWMNRVGMAEAGEVRMEADESVTSYAERATELLVRIADTPTPELERAYDALLFPVLLPIVRRRGIALAAGVRSATGAEISVPRVRPADLDSISLDVTVAALAVARRTAERFDPRRGDGATWAIGAAKLAYLDVVRDFYQTRRAGTQVPTDPEDLATLSDLQRRSVSPEEVAETRAALRAALDRLTEDERFVVLAQAQYGMSYAEIATYRFGDPSATKTVDRLLQSARPKLAEAEAAWRREDP